MRDEEKTKKQLIDELVNLRQQVAQFKAQVKEYQQVEQALQESEALYRTLFENAPLGIGLADIEGNLIAFNDAMLQPGGYSHDDIAKLKTVAALYYDVRERERILETARRQRYLDRTEVQFKRKDGTPYDAFLRLTPVQFNSQFAWLAIVEDITERKQTENALSKSERQYHRLFNNAPIGIVSADKHGNILAINPAALKMLGSPSAEETQKINLLTFPLLIEAEITSDIRHCLETGTEVISEKPYLSKWGKSTYFRFHMTPIQEPDGSTIGLQIILEDITERKQAEEELRKSEAQNQAILDAIPDLMFTLDHDGTLLSFNAPSDKDLYASPEQIMGNNIRDIMPPAFVEQCLDSIQKTLETGELQTFEYQLPLSQGVQDFEARLAVAGENQVLAVVRNITQRKRAAEQQVELRVQRERIQLLEELVSDLSHDIKTPLSSINTFLTLLEKQLESEKQRQYMNKLESQVQRLGKLVEDILIMSQLDKGAALTFTPLNLNYLIKSVASSYVFLAEAKDITLTFNPSTDVPPIPANEVELGRALANLIENALNYTSKGGSITIQTYRAEGEVAIEIHDTGMGINQSDLPHIFNRFYRADKARNTQTGGTGLGLAIVKKIIELHGGRLNVHSTLGEGSVFSVHLPAG